MLAHTIEYGDYMPHGMCLLWQPWLLALWAGSDFLIFVSYTAIPIALLIVLRQRAEVPHGSLVALFASFILLCGLTHLLGIVTLWVPIYPWVGLVKLATGIVSATTAFALFKLIPDIVRLPSPAALQTANRRLREEIVAHKATLATLDEQVRERTSELENATAALAVQAREALHRSSNLLVVVSVLAKQSAKTAQRPEDFLASFLGRLQALSIGMKSFSKSDQPAAELRQVVEAGLSFLEETLGPRVTFSGPSLKINPEAAQQLSLALYELSTNTQKYGLGLSETASLEVSWSFDDREFTLVWHERGIVEPGKAGREAATGFGTTLLLHIIPSTLGGEAERLLEHGEMIYRLRVPIEAVRVAELHSQNGVLAARIIEGRFGTT